MRRLKFEYHGLRGSPEYKIWDGMIYRCHGKNSNTMYKQKGIKVCDKWRNSFVAFYNDMGPRPSSKHSIDRINSDGNYEPSNCRWATASIQNLNRKKKSHPYPSGVSFSKVSKKFKVVFRRKHLGYFSDLEQAVLVRKKAEQDYGL